MTRGRLWPGAILVAVTAAAPSLVAVTGPAASAASVRSAAGSVSLTATVASDNHHPGHRA